MEGACWVSPPNCAYCLLSVPLRLPLLLVTRTHPRWACMQGADNNRIPHPTPTPPPQNVAKICFGEALAFVGALLGNAMSRPDTPWQVRRAGQGGVGRCAPRNASSAPDGVARVQSRRCAREFAASHRVDTRPAAEVRQLMCDAQCQQQQQCQARQ